jgi:hypothetical protein
MQNAMARVNEQNRSQGLPEIEMGIGLNEDEVIVGNIGSSKRSKYGVVGSGVNMTSRIESYSVGGQILISDSVRKQAGNILRIDEQREVIPKGAESPIRIYEVGGIGDPYHLALEAKDPAPVVLATQVPLLYAILDGKDAGGDQRRAFVYGLSRKGAEMEMEQPLDPCLSGYHPKRAVPGSLACRRSAQRLGTIKQCKGLARFYWLWGHFHNEGNSRDCLPFISEFAKNEKNHALGVNRIGMP